ncbi:MAG: SpoIID/LytB domain-containing protein [Ruminococcaceae bacterium]|nr:SpoIID/LytB domain-containing protein [Oscillospiraceae bacterium]
MIARGKRAVNELDIDAFGEMECFMTLKLRQIAALLLAAAICLETAGATEMTVVPDVDVSVGVTEDGVVQEPTAETVIPDMEEPEETAETGDTSQEVEEPVMEQPPQEGEGEVEPEPEPEIYDPYANTVLRVGLAYPGNSTGSLVNANLLNADISTVAGYRFGYYDDALTFIGLASTAETAITMLKTTNIYRMGEEYSDKKPSGDHEVLGCYHLQRPFAFATYEEAIAMVNDTLDSFVSWVDGVYYVRKGSYTNYDEAKAAADAEPAANWSVSYTSVYGINVVKTGTCEILFQFDGGEKRPLGVMPGTETEEGAVTWFKGFKYRGGFRYERVDGGNLVVVNLVDVDTYVKGVVPYESNKLWPLETLKAQALCAKNYGLINLNKHNGYHFDLCNTTDCQVYYGLGSNKDSFQPSSLSDQAVDEIRGMYVWYEDKLAHTYFYSSNGGGSEDSSKVWGSNQASYPYLIGVVDPYEETVADTIPNYEFSNTFNCAQLTTILQSKGYATNTQVVDFQVTEYSKSGNVLTMKFTYANGKSNTFASSNSSWLRNKLGCRSMHFTVNGAGEVLTGACTVNDGLGESIENFSGLYALSGEGELVQLTQSVPYIITGTGDVTSAGQSSTIPEGTFVVSGTGWGHNVGYSQWGGYAMAKLGYTCEEILKFYFTGVEVGVKQSDNIENI